MPMLNERLPKERRNLHDREQRLRGMRLAVDSLEMSIHPLADRLAGLRNRIQPALERKGMQMQWNVRVSEDMALPAGVLATEIFGILQETLGHVLQHSGAVQVTVTMAPVPGQGTWRFEVCDNGAGGADAADAGGAAPGQRVQGLHERARRAGLHLVCEALAQGGTRVCVEAPGHAAPALQAR